MKFSLIIIFAQCGFSLLAFLSVSFAENEDTITTKQGTKIVNHQASGNLEVTHQIGCLGIDKLNNTYTPADLYNAIPSCIVVKKYSESVQLFALAGTFGRFDVQRVADKTAHQALQVMIMQSLGNASEAEKKEFQAAIQALLGAESNPTNLKEFCQKVKKIEAPTYFPRYMIQHGMGAFTPEDKGDGIVKDFDPQKAWDTALDSYLHCPKE